MAEPPRSATDLIVGGIPYRVFSTADESELQRLAELVDARLSALPASQRSQPRSLVLVALALAHELDRERSAHLGLRTQVSERLRLLLNRVDDALDHRDEAGNPLPLPVLKVANQTEPAAISAGPDEPEVPGDADADPQATETAPQAPPVMTVQRSRPRGPANEATAPRRPREPR